MLLLFSFLSFAEEMSSEKYCFSSELQALTAKQKFRAIQVNSDIVSHDENCLIIQMKPHRREMIQRFLLSSVPGTRVTFSSAEIRREPCLLKVEKQKQSNRHNLNAGYEKYPVLNKHEQKNLSSEVMQIQTLKDFELAVDQDQIKGSCRYLNANRYEITIEVKRNPKPITPVELPPGTIVVVNQTPPDQETMSLQTQLQLSRGEKVELAHVVKQLKDKDNKVEIKPSFQYNAKDKNSVEKVYLSIQ